MNNDAVPHIPDTEADRLLVQRILWTATPLFVTQGYTGTRLDEIARACGISKKTLYKYFPTKEALLRYGIDVLFGMIKADNDAIIAQSDVPARERIAQIMERTTGVFSFVGSPNLINDIRRSAPAVWEHIMAWRAAHMERFMVLLEESLATHEVRAGLSADDVRAAFRITLLQATEFLSSGNIDVESADVYTGFLDIFFHGIMEEVTPEAA
ncbi:MAG: TetR/AcrR family transcriptional regulator [Candidatus Kapabacteria bacterium]|nr:TetR/AcrR family transcriptional regulator [Candidatus Kapabacteria bacterium]